MITIFTPIYNRAYIVQRLYESLLRQTCYNFEWLIVDDGSVDDVALIVQKWVENTQQFKIRFYRQENKGKHCAINYGVKLARYEMFFIVDSDDYLEDDAIETILRYWKGIGANYRFAGISGLSRDLQGEIIGGSPYFEEYEDATNIERAKFGLEGDKAEVLRTELLRRFPFPEYENEKFITEAVVWDRIAYEGYKMRWINKSLKICEYLKDGLTAKGDRLFRENPRGWAHFIRTGALYRNEETSVRLKKCYYYYEWECKRFTDYEIKELLCLNSSEFELITKQYQGFMQRIVHICHNKKVCIYGYGQWGKRLKHYLDNLRIKVGYVIDKNCKEIKGIPAYSIEMQLPKVEVVFIALSIGTDEVIEIVRNKMKEVKVILCKDIIPALW